MCVGVGVPVGAAVGVGVDVFRCGRRCISAWVWVLARGPVCGGEVLSFFSV